MRRQLSKNIHSALLKKYEAVAETALANIAVYESNMAGIGEHGIIVETIEEEYQKLDSALSMIETLKKHPIG